MLLNDAVHEVDLFAALCAHKAVGINRHFQMICIQEILTESIPQDCDKVLLCEDVWQVCPLHYFSVAAVHVGFSLDF